MYRPGFNYVKAGVMLVDLRPQGQEQGELDLVLRQPEERAGPRRGGTVRTDGCHGCAEPALRARGASRVASAAQRSGTGSGYVSKQERRSPRYTTRLDEIPTAR